MKNLLKISVFILTFLIGSNIQPTIKDQPTAVATKTVIPETPTEIVKETQTESKEEDIFKPEIFGLEDFSDQEILEHKMKLLDLVETGNNFYKDEAVAKSGETWLGVFEKDGQYIFRHTKLKVVPETRKDYGWDDSVIIKIKDKTKPMFLLKNAGNIGKGEIKTLFRSKPYLESNENDRKSVVLDRDFNKEFRLGDEKYILKVKFGLTKSNDKVSVLILEHNQTSQIVTYNTFFEKGDYIGDLLWVGDLDNDGKLDFYLSDYGFEKGGIGLSLFLSSKAGKGKLVKEAAHFGGSGC